MCYAERQAAVSRREPRALAARIVDVIGSERYEIVLRKDVLEVVDETSRVRKAGKKGSDAATRQTLKLLG